MKNLSEYSVGDSVVILNHEDLTVFLEFYNIDLKTVTNDPALHDIDALVSKLSNQIAYISQDPVSLLEDAEWDGLMSLILHSDSTRVRLPFATLLDMDENEEVVNNDSIYNNNSELTMNNDKKVIRHGPSEDFMIKLLAAETIQEAYRYITIIE